MKRFLAENKLILLFIVAATIAAAALFKFVIHPAYTNSSSRLYTSSLGHPNILRKTGKPIPVKITQPKTETIQHFILGEGTCSSQPILVPIVPMAVITDVLVKEGDTVTKGQPLATLDSSKAQIKYNSAKLAVSTAEAELQRVRLGSAYVLAQERPEVEKINLAALEKQVSFAKEQLDRFEKAFKQGVISKVKLLESRTNYTKLAEQLAQAKLSTTMAEEGVEQSLKIAENSVDDTKQALAHREEELKAYQILSPADGIIDRVLINPGEYNQDSGKPGFLIASGLWFDGYFDQSEFPHIKTGQTAKISLESYPGQQFPATINAIKPIVSFNTGGPEISRPLRPRGSGSPEWAATFKTKINFDSQQSTENIIPGMTGFARLSVTRESLTVPRSAVLSISAGSALVYLVPDPSAENPAWKIQSVRVGKVTESYAEILSGLTSADQVMIDGHWTLQKEDKIKVQQP